MSGGELVLLMVTALLAFGARRLPEVGSLMGRGLRNFHRALNEARSAVSEDLPARRESTRRLID